MKNGREQKLGLPPPGGWCFFWKKRKVVRIV
jgi:hypothetical protein